MQVKLKELTLERLRQWGCLLVGLGVLGAASTGYVLVTAASGGPSTDPPPTYPIEQMAFFGTLLTCFYALNAAAKTVGNAGIGASLGTAAKEYPQHNFKSLASSQSAAQSASHASLE